jgi:formate hydrogenlyase subunit 4
VNVFYEFLRGAVQGAAVLVGAPVLIGLMRTVRARLEGRQGPRVTQPLRDLVKLAAKQRVRPEESSWVFAAGPVVLGASAVALAVVTPLATLDPPLAHSADFFAVVFVLLAGTVALALAALDTGTAFGGMGASRALTIGALAEPALLVAVLAMSLPAKTSNLPALVRAGLEHPALLVAPARLLALASMLIVVLAESGRLPVDNPATHLELTMINEAMVLEYSGPDLALVSLGEWTRFAVLLGLLVNLLIPWGVARGPGVAPFALGLVVVAAKVALAATAVAIFEVTTAKLRLFRLPELLAGGFILAVVGAVTAVVTR